jgi:hypothetical protein
MCLINMCIIIRLHITIGKTIANSYQSTSQAMRMIIIGNCLSKSQLKKYELNYLFLTNCFLLKLNKIISLYKDNHDET